MYGVNARVGTSLLRSAAAIVLVLDDVESWLDAASFLVSRN